MQIHVYEADEFIGGRDSEQRIVYFEAKKGKKQIYDTFEAFVKACMLYEEQLDYFVPFNRYDLERMIEEDFLNAVKPLASEDFFKNLSHIGFCDALIESRMQLPSNIIKCVSVNKQEWNYIFHIIESDTGFYGYNWMTSA